MEVVLRVEECGIGGGINFTPEEEKQLNGYLAWLHLPSKIRKMIRAEAKKLEPKDRRKRKRIIYKLACEEKKNALRQKKLLKKKYKQHKRSKVKTFALIAERAQLLKAQGYLQGEFPAEQAAEEGLGITPV